jgi:hypothetical protein
MWGPQSAVYYYRMAQKIAEMDDSSILKCMCSWRNAWLQHTELCVARRVDGPHAAGRPQRWEDAIARWGTLRWGACWLQSAQAFSKRDECAFVDWVLAGQPSM